MSINIIAVTENELAPQRWVNIILIVEERWDVHDRTMGWKFMQQVYKRLH